MKQITKEVVFDGHDSTRTLGGATSVQDIGTNYELKMNENCQSAKHADKKAEDGTKSKRAQSKYEKMRVYIKSQEAGPRR